jgi:putative nucleotidyltransferase with HDIG domain
MRSVAEKPADGQLEFGTGLRDRLLLASKREAERKRSQKLAALNGRERLAVVAGPQPKEHGSSAPPSRIVTPGSLTEFFVLEGLGVDEEELGFFLMLANTVDGRESLSLEHSKAIAALSADLAGALGLDHDAAARTYLAGLVHDLGKIELSEALLRKPGPLSRSEWQEMTSHPSRGAEVVERVSGLADVAQIVASHHERWDGVGYPYGLGGDQIPIEARIVGAADALVSMTTTRPYRNQLSLPAALENLLRQAGSAYDPTVVSGLLSLAFEGKLSPAQAA